MSKINEIYKMLAELNSSNNKLNEQIEIINYNLNQNIDYLNDIQKIYSEIMVNFTKQYIKDINE